MSCQDGEWKGIDTQGKKKAFLIKFLMTDEKPG